MNKKKLIIDFDASLEQMAEAIKLFHNGKISFYRTIAVQLRFLISKKTSLVRIIFKQSAFHPLRGSFSNLDPALRKNLVFQSPALIEFKNGKPKILELFNKNVSPLKLDDWLNQPLFNNSLTIAELINSVADKESAHADKEYNQTLNFTNSVNLGTDKLHPHYIVAIGEYVLFALKEIRSLLSDDFDKWGKS